MTSEFVRDPDCELVLAAKRRGVQCGTCGQKFEPNHGYVWNCRQPRCPFPYAQGSFHVVAQGDNKMA